MEVREALELFEYDAERIELGKQRQKAVWESEEPDNMPVIIHGRLTEEQEQIQFVLKTLKLLL